MNNSSSRLVEYLQTLLMINPCITHQGFIAKIAKLVDFSMAMDLSDTLRAKAEILHVSSVNSTPDVLLIDCRAQRLSFIQSTFDPVQVGRGLPFRLPLTTDRDFSHNDQGLSSYLRFYALHQSELEIHLSQLNKQLRDYLSQANGSLARLAMLDEALTGVLYPYARQQLVRIPRLLKQRFQYLLTTENIGLFVKEMQQVLLAELDIRLQLNFGLVEAFVNIQNDSAK